MHNVKKLAIASLVLILSACSPAQQPGRPGAPTLVATPIPLPTAIAAARQTVAVDGALALAQPAVGLAFETSGRVLTVTVQPGQRVGRGDLIARLDDTALQDALAQAREQLALLEARQAQAAAPTTSRQADIDSARAALAAAQAAYAELDKRPTASGIELAQRAWNQARDQLWSAQISRDAACGLSASSATCKSNDANVGALYESERAAYQRYLDAQKGASAQEYAQAWSNIQSADARLRTLTEPISQTVEQKRVAAAELAQAQGAVARAERNLARATLLSPCACVVQDVAVAVGATAGAAPVVTLSQIDALVFRSSNLSERDLGAIRVGAPATLRLKPFDREFNGRVSAILPQSSGTQGNAAIFTILIAVDAAGSGGGIGLLPGMTGQAEVTVR